MLKVKVLFDKVLNLIFEEEEEINEAQYLTMLHFTKKILMSHGNIIEKDAKKLAIAMVEQWIRDGEHKTCLKRFWQEAKIA